MRILFVTQFFAPEGFIKGLPFARELKRRGHEVEVLTGFPNFPGGKIFPGYRVRPWQRETMEGISVLRVPLYPSHDRSAIRRAMNYGSFALCASVGSLFVKRPDVIYVYHPPATIGLPALVARMLYKAPVVYDIQDLWPDTVATTGMVSSAAALSFLGRWCGMVYQKSDRIVVLSPGFKRALIHRGVPESKIDVIYNWCDESLIAGNDREPVRFANPGEFTVLFAGTMGLAQALDSVLEAARLCALSVPRARFIFVGQGIDRERLERKAAEMTLKNVAFLPSQPMDRIGCYLSAADALLVHLKDDPLFRITIPSKTQAYLAAGKPIVMAVRGDAAALIESARAGIVCEPERPESIARAVTELASSTAARLVEMGQAGREFYRKELSLSAGVDRFAKAFAAVVN